MPLPKHKADPRSSSRRIVLAAQKEMIECGIDGTSIDAIAARAGSSKQTIYDRFKSKTELFKEALRLTIAEAGGASLPDIADLDQESSLREIGIWLDCSARAPANLGLYRANIGAAARFPDLSIELHDLRSHSHHLRAYMEALPARRIEPQLPAATLAQWFGVLSTGGLHYLLNLPANKIMDRVRIDAAVHLFARGWRTPVARSLALPVEHASTKPLSSNPGRTSPSRWEELLRHTARSLLEAGIRGTSIDQLTSSIGLSKMTIYRRYGDKDGLVAAALHWIVDGLTADVPIAPPGGDLHAMLIAVARDHRRRFARQENLALLRLMVSEATYRSALVAQLWNRLAAPGLAILSEALAARNEAGEIHLTDPNAAAEQFLLLSAEGNRLLTGAPVERSGRGRDHTTLLVAFCLRPSEMHK